MERALGEPDVRDDALVGVVVGVEDEAPERRLRVALRGGHPLHDGLQHQVDVGALLGRHEDDLLARDGQHVLQLLHHHLGLGGRQVDLVDDGHDDQALGEREVDVGERLGLDALGGIDHEDGALAGLEAAAHLVAEVDVTGRVDEVEAVRQAVACGVLQAHGAGLDGDALLALQVHRIEHLAGHLARLDGVRQLQDAVRQRRLAVVDVGDDAEVAQARLGDGGHGARASIPKRRVGPGVARRDCLPLGAGQTVTPDEPTTTGSPDAIDRYAASTTWIAYAQSFESIRGARPSTRDLT